MSAQFEPHRHPRDERGRFREAPTHPGIMTSTAMVNPLGGNLIRLGPETLRVLRVIRSIGGKPLLVGGSVRDALMGRGNAPKDIDIEVYGCDSIDALTGSLERVGKVNAVGRSFGVLKVRSGTQDIDISLPRRDSKMGSGHRGFLVRPDANLSEKDASGRRDFTINSIMWDPATGEIIDYWNGIADMRDKLLRHTTAAFSEDPLRVLRGVQFAARFDFHFADETAQICNRLADSYSELPVERVWVEFEKIGLMGTSISTGLSALRASGWDRHFPQIISLYDVPQDPKHHPEGDVITHTGLAADAAAKLADQAHLGREDRLVLIFGAMAHDFGKPSHTQSTKLPDGTTKITSHGHAVGGVEPAKAFLNSIGCPEQVTRRVLPVVREHMCVANGDPSPAAVHRLARRLLPASINDWARVVEADHAGRGGDERPNPAAAWLQIANSQEVHERPRRGLLTGEHLISAGLRPGPSFKPILAEALEAQDEGTFSDEEGALLWFRRRTQQQS